MAFLQQILLAASRASFVTTSSITFLVLFVIGALRTIGKRKKHSSAEDSGSFSISQQQLLLMQLATRSVGTTIKTAEQLIERAAILLPDIFINKHESPDLLIVEYILEDMGRVIKVALVFNEEHIVIGYIIVRKTNHTGPVLTKWFHDQVMKVSSNPISVKKEGLLTYCILRSRTGGKQLFGVIEGRHCAVVAAEFSQKLTEAPAGMIEYLRNGAVMTKGKQDEHGLDSKSKSVI